MHEYHHDTWNLSKRKPQRFRGTLANKYGHLLAGGCVVLFTIGCHLYTNADWVEGHKERLFALITPTALDVEKKIIMQDALLGSAIRNLQDRRIEQGLSLDPDTIINNRERPTTTS